MPEINTDLIKKHALSLEFDKDLEILSNFAISDIGKQKCLCAPIYSQKAQIEYRLELTTEAKKILDNAGNFSYFALDFLCDGVKLLETQRLGAQDIINLAKNLKSSRLVKNFLSKEDGCINLKAISSNLYTNKELEDKIFSIFDSEFNLKDNASPELKRLRNSYKSTKDNLKTEIGKLLSNADFVSRLQDIVWTTREGRTVFQVKATEKNKVQGIVYDVSASSRTYFIEPAALVGINNKLRQIEVEINAETERILRELTKEFTNIKKELDDIQNILGELDFIFACAKYSIRTKSVPAQICDDKIIEIQAMRHPLLIGQVENIVANDFELGKSYNSLLITGSNTGGKTVTLKTAGLLTLMTKAGLHISALGANIYPFDAVLADISEEQSISQNLSTFSAHIKNISSIIDNSTPNSLVLFDELGAGTDPEEGAALARAILEYLSKNNTLCVSTTHLGELKILKYENDKFENASVEFDLDTLKPAYKLLLGIAGSSNALDIASNLNLKEEITLAAKEILAKSKTPENDVFEKIQQTHALYTKKEREAQQMRDKTAQIEAEYEEKLKELKAQKKKSLENFKRKYQAQIEAAREEIKETLDIMRKEKSEKIAMRSYSRLARLESAAREEFLSDEEKLQNKYEPLNPDDLKVGQNVLIKGLEQVARLEGLPDKKGKVLISIGLMKTKIDLKKLAKTDKKISKALKKVSVSFDDITQTLSNRLDIRGMRAEDAIDFLDKQFDMASLRNLREIVVIHGHGTGALKSAVRNYLSNSPYVAKFRAGGEGEGGDGVTIVDIN